jgi:hypothetical protein
MTKVRAMVKNRKLVASKTKKLNNVNLQQLELKAMLEVATEARQWWTSHRPEVYTLDEHLANPTVNQPNPSNDGLCVAVSKWVALSSVKA